MPRAIHKFVGMNSRMSRSFVSPISNGSMLNPLLFLKVNRRFSGTPYEQSLMEKLQSAPELSQPSMVLVEDRSGGCGANFYVSVESKVFKGLPRLQQHRIVQDVLKDEISKWHAVSIDTRTPPP